MVHEERLKAALADRYQVQRAIGSGGMATVFLAQDLRHERQVAVKVLNPELAATLGAERFLREIKTAANLTHPHILPVHDSGETDNFLYYVMPYVEGETLRHRLAREKQLPIDDALRIAREVADALNYAHSHDVVHRDIKPENILLESGHAVVADFGIARAVDVAGGERLTETGIALGTPAYMSPEQAGGEKSVDGRSDLYSLGCVLHEMLAGEPPFTGATVESVVRQHLVVEPPKVTEARPSVPMWVAAALERSLAKIPADRFDPVALFGEAISPRVGVMPPGTVSLNRPARRKWMMAGGVVGAAAILVVIAIMAGLPRGGGLRLNPDQVVVTVFRNETGDPALDQLGSRAGHWVTQGIQQAAIAVTPWDMALESWDFVQSERDAGRVRDPIRALAEETGAGTVISGAVYLENDSLEIQVNVTDAVRGRPLGTVNPVRGARESARELIADMQHGVMGFLAIAFDERIAGHASSVLRPPSYEAYRAFDEGMRYYIPTEYEEALNYFHRAFELDSTFVTPLIYAVLCYHNRNEWAQSDSLLAILERHREWLSDYDRHWLDYLEAGSRFDNEEALRAIRRAAVLAPGSKAVYNQARAASRVNRPQEAVDALLSLDPRRGPMRGWRSYYRVLIQAYSDLDEHGKALDAARQYQDIYGNDQETLAYLGFALAALGRIEELRGVLHELEALQDQGRGFGLTISRVATYLRRLGYSDAATAMIDRAIRWYETRPPEAKASAEWRSDYMWTLFVADRWEEAYSVARALSEDFPENVNYRGPFGVFAGYSEHRDEALETSRWLEDLAPPGLGGWDKMWRAGIAASLGDGESAVALMKQGASEGFPQYPPWTRPWLVFDVLCDYPPYQELMRPKG
ncbi:MAG: serine/threonine-protein kinase [Gemmatimonadota bacterium]|jgi:tetratricopeptide (TPR) repeat protein